MERCAECAGSLPLKIRCDMRIDVCGDSERTVAQSLLNHFHRRAEAEQDARVSMAKVVWSNLGQFRCSQRTHQRPPNLVWSQMLAEIVREDISICFPQVTHFQADFVLSDLVGTQDVDQVAVN